MAGFPGLPPVPADLVIAPHYCDAFRGRRAENCLLQCESVWDGQEFAEAVLDYVTFSAWAERASAFVCVYEHSSHVYLLTINMLLVIL